MEVLIDLDSNLVYKYYAMHFIGVEEKRVIQNPFESGAIHPVANRVQTDKVAELQEFFIYIKTYSEEFGNEEGYISESIKKKIDLVPKSCYEEAKARQRELTTEVIESLEAKTKAYEDKFWKAREEYKQSLLDLGYIEDVQSDYDRDTEIYMVHPLYLTQWRKDWFPRKYKYPDWAVKEIGFFATEE